MRTIERGRAAVGTFIPVVLTVATMGPVAGAAHLDPGLVVLGAAICLTTARRLDVGSGGLRQRLLHLVRVPAITAAVAVVGLLFTSSLVLGDVFFVAVVLLAGHARRYGQRAATIGRAAMLPLVALFIAPVRMDGHPAGTLGWALVTCLVATGWTIVVATVVPAPRLSAAEVVRPARKIVAAARRGRLDGTIAARRRLGRAVRARRQLNGAALALDAALARDATPTRDTARDTTATRDTAYDADPPADAVAARRALCAVEYRADRVIAGQDPPDRLEEAVTELRATLPARRGQPASEQRSAREHQPAPEHQPASEQRSAPEHQPASEQQPAPEQRPAPTAASARAAGRLATQSAVGLALAFAVGQLLFPAHWTWTVITAFTVSVGARSRGEVVVKSVERLIGALGGTTVATLLAAALIGGSGPGGSGQASGAAQASGAGNAAQTAIALVVILGFLAAGLYLREINYAWWAFCFTAVLAVLYGLIDHAAGPELLGVRLVEIVLGGLCAAVPALVLRPIRSRDLARKRMGECLRRIREALDAGARDVATARRIETAIGEVDKAARPLLVIRRLRYRPEVAWARRLGDCRQAVHALPFEDDEPASRLWSAYAAVGRDLKAAVRARA